RPLTRPDCADRPQWNHRRATPLPAVAQGTLNAGGEERRRARVRENRMHGSRWRREETRPVGPARAAQPRRLSPTLPVPRGRGAVKTPDQDGVEVMSSSYAGVDWASEKHDVVIGEETGGEILAA